MQAEQSAYLMIREWLAITIVIGIMSVLTLFAVFNEKAGDAHLAPVPKSQYICEIVLKGAVNHPGSYYLPAEMSLRDLLNLAEPLPNADLRRFKLDQALNRTRLITIPESGARARRK